MGCLGATHIMASVSVPGFKEPLVGFWAKYPDTICQWPWNSVCGLMVLTLLLAKKCPGNMVYLESSSPCVDTCSHLEVSSLCEEHYMDGCFCPEGTCSEDPCPRDLVGSRQGGVVPSQEP